MGIKTIVDTNGTSYIMLVSLLFSNFIFAGNMKALEDQSSNKKIHCGGTENGLFRLRSKRKDFTILPMPYAGAK